MGIVVSHNLNSMFTGRQIKGISDDQKKSTEKLSSGYRINRAADDAAGLNISEKMRAQIRGLNRASHNIEDGASLCNVADGALTEIHSIIQRQRELLVQGANDTYIAEDKEKIQMEIDALNKEADRIFNDTEFNTRKIFKGDERTVIPPATTVTELDPIKKIVNKVDGPSSRVLWRSPTEPLPSNVVDDINDYGTKNTNTSYTVKEDELNDGNVLRTETTEVKVTEFARRTITNITYEDIGLDSEYTKLRTPGEMTGNNGYINVTNVAGDLSLSCYMSKLGARVDGVEVGVVDNTSDLYRGAVSSTTTCSTDGKTATTVYDLGNGVSLTQKIVSDDTKYVISYSATNDSSSSHVVDTRLAFDVVNQSGMKAALGTSFSVALDYVNIPMSSTDADVSLFCDIANIYDHWGYNSSILGKTFGTHNGFGNWWNDRTVAPGETIDIGSVTYGPMEYTKIPYRETKTVETQTGSAIETTITETCTVFEPEYLHIQAGANSWQDIRIRLYNLTAENLNLAGISLQEADNSFSKVDYALDRISNIRSYYGAVTNRLLSAYNNDVNAAENLQTSESKIRDVDMATELIQNSKSNIIAQSAESMLSDANEQMNNVLSLLQFNE